MKGYKILSITVVAALLVSMSAFVFASPGNKDSNDSKLIKQDKMEIKKDPVIMLEKHKERIQRKYNDGKISKEQYDEIIAKIDKRIKELKDFDKLTLQQKKDKLVKDFTDAVNTKVKEGKLTQEKADSIISKFKAKIDKWNGDGYPNFHKMTGRDHKLPERFKNALNKAVKAGKITKEQKQYIIDSLKDKKLE